MMDPAHHSRGSNNEQQYQQFPQQQERYQIEPRQRRFYMVIDMLLTFLDFFLLTRSRFVQNFVPPIANNLPSAPPRWLSKSRPSSRNTKVHPTNLYRYLHCNMVTGIVMVALHVSPLFFPFCSSQPTGLIDSREDWRMPLQESWWEFWTSRPIP